jgi:hypothetical protein
VSQTNTAKSARSSFALTTNFAVYVNSFPYLKLAWKNSKVNGSNHYQKIIKNNVRQTKKYGLSVNNIISPPGIAFSVEEISLSATETNLRITPDSEELIGFLKQPYFLNIIFYFFEPARKTTTPCCFSGIQNEIRQAPGTGSYVVKLSLSEEINLLIKKYEKAITYLAASLAEPGSKKVFWTSTFSKEIIF